MRKLFLIAALLCPSAILAQMGNFQTILLSGSGQPIGGAHVAVCSTGLTTTAASVTNNVATLTMSSNPITAGFLATHILTVSGFTAGDTFFNVTTTITAVSATTISFPLTHGNASAGTNGKAFQTGDAITPCAPLVTLYTDDTGTTTSANPFTSDSIGNVSIWAPSGIAYQVQYYGQNVVTKVIEMSIGLTQGSTITTLTVTNLTAGTGTFTGLLLCKNLQSIQCVSGTNTVSDQGWTGTDLGAWLNSAYAALPSTGGEIWVFPKADHSCYSEGTQANFSTSGKSVMVRFYGSSKGDPNSDCVLFTNRGGVAAFFFDNAVSPARSFNPANNGINGMTLINVDAGGVNGCVASGGCSSSALGIQIGNTNSGMLNGDFNNVSIAGFSGGFVVTNGASSNINFENPVFVANSIGVNYGHVNGLNFKGGIFAGNGNAIRSTATSGGELMLDGVSFVSNTECIDSEDTVGAAAVAYITNSHFETTSTPAGSSHIIHGNINFTLNGGLIEDDAATGSTDYFISTTGTNFEIHGTIFSSPGRTFTQAILVNSPVRAKIYAINNAPTVLTTMVGGANVAFTTVNIQNGSSANASLLSQWEGPAKCGTGGFGDASFVPSSSVCQEMAANSANFDFIRMRDTGSTPRDIRLGPGTGGCTGGGFAIRDQTGTKQLECFFYSGNIGFNGVLQNVGATSTMGLTLKKGSGAGNYTNATTSYTVADSTNLCFTVTIPTGWKLGVSASGALATATAAVVAQAALTDNAACSTANAGIIVETAPIQGAAIAVADSFALNWVITGDGAAHNVALQFKTSNAADTASLINSSATITPTMKFELQPSN